MERIRVAIVQNVPVTDHRMVHTDGLSRELINAGHEATVIIQKSSNRDQFHDPPYETVQLNGSTYSVYGQMQFTLELLSHLRKNEYDIIHAKNPFSSTLAPLILRKTGARFKLVYDIRGLWVDFMNDVKDMMTPWTHLLNKIDVACMNSCDGVITISSELFRILIERGVHEDKIRTITGDGVNAQKIENLTALDLNDLYGLKGSTLGYIGSIGKGRSSHRIIEAFRHVKERVPDANLVMIGPIYREDSIRDTIRGLNIEDSVFLTGYMESHDTVLRYCKSFDVALAYHEKDLPSFNVMVPTKILEYLACGRPIVATDHCAHNNILSHGHDAYLTPQTPEQFADGIIHVLENEKLRQTLSLNSLQSAKDYSFENISRQVLDFYDEIIC